MAPVITIDLVPLPAPVLPTGPAMTMPGVVYAQVVTRESAPHAIDCEFEIDSFPSYRPLVISEVAWMGSKDDSGSEWIELRNASSGPISTYDYWLIDKAEQIKIHLPDVLIEPGGFFLFERSEEVVPDVDADVLYSGSLANTNEALRLFDPWCALVDEVIAEPKWPAGDSVLRRTMERSINWQWHTYSGTGENEIFGTPKKENSIQREIVVLPVVPTTASASASPSPVIQKSVCTSSQVNLNTALQVDLETIVHIGPALAARIIESRPFSSVEELDIKVKGIGEKYLADIISEGKACAF